MQNSFKIGQYVLPDPYGVMDIHNEYIYNIDYPIKILDMIIRARGGTYLHFEEYPAKAFKQSGFYPQIATSDHNKCPFCKTKLLKRSILQKCYFFNYQCGARIISYSGFDGVILYCENKPNKPSILKSIHKAISSSLNKI